jgi:hypothetical protein
MKIVKVPRVGDSKVISPLRELWTPYPQPCSPLRRPAIVSLNARSA